MAKITLPILMYHGVNSPQSLVSIDPENFLFQMRWLFKNGYKTISLNQIKQYLDGHVDIPESALILTFDDGYESLYHNALPALKEFGFTATIFLVSGYCGKDNQWGSKSKSIPRLPLLSWNQIREMDRAGLEFGSHTVMHPRLDMLELEMIEKEAGDSKRQIENELGHSIGSFAYPFGWYNSSVKQIISQYYDVACSTRMGLANPLSDIYALERVEIFYLLNPRIFSMLSRPYFPAYINIRKAIRNLASLVMYREWR